MKTALLINGTSIEFYRKCLAGLKKQHDTDQLFVDSGGKTVKKPERTLASGYAFSSLTKFFINHLEKFVYSYANSPTTYCKDESVKRLIADTESILEFL